VTLIKHTKTTSTGGTTVAGVIDSASRNGRSAVSAKQNRTLKLVPFQSVIQFVIS
jgi:hypothetical protein